MIDSLSSTLTGACPPRIRNGTPARVAVRAGVTVLVTPGPRVTAHTPGDLVIRAVPSAMKAAAASWRVWTMRTGARNVPWYIGLRGPPETEKMCCTPLAASRSTTRSPPG